MDIQIVALITASLVVQLVVLFLLFYGLVVKKKQKYRQHGIVMAAALIIHLIMVLYIMVPSFTLAIVPGYIAVSPFELISMVGLIHGILGTVAIALGILLVAAWHFQKNLNPCFGRKQIMRYTFITWTLALILGAMLYVIFIGQLLMG